MLIPIGSSNRAVTKSSHERPLTAWMTSPATRYEHVVVGVRASEARRQRDELQPLGDLAARVGGRRPPQQIARAQTKSTAVHEQVTNRQLARDVRIREPEPRQVAHDRRVPRDLLLFHEKPERQRREHLVLDAIPNCVRSSTSAGSPSFRTP